MESGLLAEILPDFERQTGLRVQVSPGSVAFTRARNGQADMVIAHYGHNDLEPFMADGLGLWPRPVFSVAISYEGGGRLPNPTIGPGGVVNGADRRGAIAPGSVNLTVFRGVAQTSAVALTLVR